MSDATLHDLIQQVEQLLIPGAIELHGMIVRTPYSSDDEIEMFDATLAIGDIIAANTGVEDWYVYSGNDDPEFSSNQHQGLTLETDAFVWECQQLLRDGTFDIIIYYEAHTDHEHILDAVSALGYDVIGVTPEQSTTDTEGLNYGDGDTSN